MALMSQFAQLRRERDAEAERAEERKDREAARKDREADRQYRDQGRAREQRLRDVFAKTPRTADGSLDTRRIASEAAGIDPETSLALSRQATQDETAALAHKTKLLEGDLAQLSYIAQVLGSAQDQAGWDRAKARLAQRGIPTEGMGATFDPKERDTYVQQGLTYTERINADLAKLRASANIQSKTVRFKGRAVEVPFNPDTGLYTLPDGTTSKFAEHYERPTEGESGAERIAKRQEEADQRDRERLADRWKADQISDLNQARRKPSSFDAAGAVVPRMTTAEYGEELRRITASWREMRGEGPPPGAPPSRANASRNIVLPPDRRSAPPEMMNAGQTPIAPVPRPAVPMGPASAAASPTIPATTQPATNPPSTPTMNMNTPQAIAARQGPLRAEASIVLRSFQQEQDPVKKAALYRRLVELRQQLTAAGP